MGNVPGKLENENAVRSNRSMSTSAALPHRTNGMNGARKARTSSMVGTILNSRRCSESSDLNPYKRKSTKDKERLKERHVKQLIVKHGESVDGGFLAPYGSSSIEKVDYDAGVVKSLILERRLAPFYTPLQDYDESWSHQELVKIVDGLPLHAPFSEDVEAFEGVPLGDLSQSDFDDLIDKSLSRREQRRMRSMIFNARLYRKRLLWQERENEKFLESKLEAKKPGARSNPCLPSDDLKFELYYKGVECPICFLYYPQPINMSRCCLQPICSECFVQIKRAEPHFPHDQDEDHKEEEEKDPNLLTSEPTNCPYCATSDYGITYDPVLTRKVGLQGIKPFSYVSGNLEPVESSEPARRRSLAATDRLVVTSDSLRPDWQVKLNKERMRLARRSANATAIHLSNQLVTPGHQASSNLQTHTVPSSNYHPEFAAAHAHDNGSLWPSNATAAEIENQMVEQAIKLSLAESKAAKKSSR
ncbi:LANO_0G17700g1_1 [Lachancea nothofagi CBS 11611]|uniref:LANO_0G17700g1_1 n=1 Tax=Lachancea nothofagi CBS 11611 TaxID=1266666 RepID=A0A1G4KKI7_9SACH|nr:LANO_0G17700g1_1 [Lachancea nothofagi CBS 11611]